MVPVQNPQEEDIGTCMEMYKEGAFTFSVLVFFIMSVIYIPVFYIAGAILGVYFKGYNIITDVTYIILNSIILTLCVISGVYLVHKKNRIIKDKQSVVSTVCGSSLVY